MAVDDEPMSFDSIRVDAPFDSLSSGQIACLAYVAENFTSKEIARKLDVTSHAIDERVRQILGKLGVSSRREAGRMFKDSPQWPHYQRLIDQPSQVEATAKAALEASSSGAAAPTTAVSAGEEEQAFWRTGDGRKRASLSIPLPFPTERGQRNTLGTGERIMWIVAIAIFSALAFGAVASALQGISQLFR